MKHVIGKILNFDLNTFQNLKPCKLCLSNLNNICYSSVHSNERLFLRDFVSCVEGSSGARLAQWLQPASRVDPKKCRILYSKEEFICGWPAVITVLTSDQYGDIVYVPDMKVEVKGTFKLGSTIHFLIDT